MTWGERRLGTRDNDRDREGTVFILQEYHSVNYFIQSAYMIHGT